MGREIRNVPPNWEHPQNDKGGFQPLFDEPFDGNLREWLREYELWKNGEHPDQIAYPEETKITFWKWGGGPPDPEYYRPDFGNTASWLQVYETVSEGTPVTPPFATKEELIDYLVENGDYWDQNRGDGGWTRENAKQFVERGFAMSGIFTPSTGEFKTPRDGA